MPVRTPRRTTATSRPDCRRAAAVQRQRSRQAALLGMTPDQRLGPAIKWGPPSAPLPPLRPSSDGRNGTKAPECTPLPSNGGRRAHRCPRCGPHLMAGVDALVGGGRPRGRHWPGGPSGSSCTVRIQPGGCLSPMTQPPPAQAASASPSIQLIPVRRTTTRMSSPYGPRSGFTKLISAKAPTTPSLVCAFPGGGLRRVPAWTQPGASQR